MKRKLSNQSGFTLVEIMIVVAIIALLATIAIPNFLRARERAQATTIIEEMRVVSAAIDTYAIEQNKAANDTVDWTAITPYFKKGSRLETSGGKDLFGGDIALTKVGVPPVIAKATKDKFDTAVIPADYWKPY
ncbi:MAG: type II secretion system protein [Verrucomicrobiaceae bacterium]|nr:MAG: type II secretion system protein [Verrucomicrobiaceae bacterium]